MKNKFSLEQYLAGRQPLQPERTDLPTDAELEAAEAEYDHCVSEQNELSRHRAGTPLHYGRGWGWGLSIAAAVLIAFLLWPEGDSLEQTKVEVQREPAIAQEEVPKAEVPQEETARHETKDEVDALRASSMPAKPLVDTLNHQPRAPLPVEAKPTDEAAGEVEENKELNHMANLTSKELTALEDQLGFEHTCVCKYQAAAQETQRDRAAELLQPVREPAPADLQQPAGLPALR